MKFWKMSGSGNDFVFVDGIGFPESAAAAAEPSFVRRVCEAHTGVGADGVAIFQPSEAADFALRYFNRDGSEGELCGNASLCAVRLSTELGIARPESVRFTTPAGIIRGRMQADRPQVELQPVQGLEPRSGIRRKRGELAMGFANTGVPHLVIQVADLEGIPIAKRGPELRHHESLPAGANVNWVAQDADGTWQMRTFERGVEAETLACGTGAVACAAMLRAWGRSGDRTDLSTRSGRVLTVELRTTGGELLPSLSGEGRVVYEGVLREL